MPKATCGPNDRPETGLQGQTSNAERANGAAEKGFNCNLELVSQFQGEGASYGFAWYDECALLRYRQQSQAGASWSGVLNAANRSSIQVMGYLNSRAMLEPWESLKVNTARHLLGATKGLGRSVDDKYYAFYDVTDCAHPVLKSDIEVAGSIGHAGNFTPDGMTYFGTYTLGPGVTILDIADASSPKVLLQTTAYTVHDLSFNADGTRAYFTQIPLGPTPPPNGLVIVDTSDIQSRKPNPQLRTVSTLTWVDGANAQQALPVTYGGKPYLIFSDERGAKGGNKAAACAANLPPHGFARIIDISDETNPKIVSKLMLEVSDPANCAQILNDPDRYSYSSHYCNVDNVKDPTTLACTWREGGLRVFNVRDPDQAERNCLLQASGEANPVPARLDLLYGHQHGDHGWRPHRGPDAHERPLRSRQERALVHEPGQRLPDRALYQRSRPAANGGGGCSTTGGSFAPLLGLGFVLLRRRLRRRASSDVTR